jgi:hypothetical protein
MCLREAQSRFLDDRDVCSQSVCHTNSRLLAGVLTWQDGLFVLETLIYPVRIERRFDMRHTSLCQTAVTAAALAACFSAHSATIYVKAGGSGLQNGSTWNNAFASPQQALAAASDGDVIWVGAGTYKPGGGQTDSFVMAADNVRMYGGFAAAGGETALNQRNPLVNLTYLSGDIDNDNILDADNVWHVVRIDDSSEEISRDTRLDGFIITMGYADGTDIDSRGGGILISMAGPVIQNCVFVKNRAVLTGGGAHIAGPPFHTQPAGHRALPTFRACRFLGNIPTTMGAARA